MASSEFLTNREQGDWAEQIVLRAINENSSKFFAVKYGITDKIASGDDGFDEFYKKYQEELNNVGKKPDILIFQYSDFPDGNVDIKNDEHIQKSVMAIEVRSSSFLVGKYNQFMKKRQESSIKKCSQLRSQILAEPYGHLLKEKNSIIYEMLLNATPKTFKELSFRRPNWSTSDELSNLTSFLRELKKHIKILHKRDYLSITPKIEDIALVNRWIQKYNVKHFYLQVFFDKAFIISFKKILELVSDESGEDETFSIERDVKNQNKTTIKINIGMGEEIIGKIELPKHSSSQKELARGRLLFYVTFDGGRGYLDHNIFSKSIING